MAVFENLTSNPDYDKPAIWIKQARCYKAIQQRPEAIKCYEKVMAEVVDNVEACLALAELYKELNEPMKAIETLEKHINVVGKDYKTGQVDLRILVQKSFIHYTLGQYHEFLDTCLDIVQDAQLRPNIETSRVKVYPCNTLETQTFQENKGRQC